jgi:ribosomal protein S19E (S16A)
MAKVFDVPPDVLISRLADTLKNEDIEIGGIPDVHQL